ncbi:MAG: FecR family protein [Pseudomonadota bacterium]|nr:FecR family protein [Pseudomonadota bacterium]
MVKFVIFILIGTTSQAETLGQFCGKIISQQGQVEVLRLKVDSQDNLRMGMKATPKMDLECRDVILTSRASRAKIKLKTTVLTLAPSSRFSIEEHDSNSHDVSLLNLTYGKIRTLVNKQANDDATFKITTPSAVMGVRGTDFFTSFDPNTLTTEQATISGTVEVEQKSTGQKVLVEKGQQVKVEYPPVVKDEEIPAAKELKVSAIGPKIVEQIKQTSYIAKDDKEFASTEAISLLGEPKKWLPPDDELPLDLKDMKNEF